MLSKYLLWKSRETFELKGNGNPAHVFLHNVRDIPIEQGWLDIRHDFDHNIPYFWKKGLGENVYVVV